jgi:hypothetical protein
MKATTNKLQKSFEPIVLRITIESQEEYENLMSLVQTDVGVPEAVYNFDKVDREKTRAILTTIKNALL